jgi:hypothetical protein
MAGKPLAPGFRILAPSFHFPLAISKGFCYLNRQTFFREAMMRAFYAFFSSFYFWYGFNFQPSARGEGPLA